ncbi:MAG: HAMP domain-containing histidine kinase [Stigonema ocellatum SAG 48.90 = DSM 106950]|nr:HAMP domain-containing histidine kinase [Stigonema ocellatum SAG 48.90 = DSM 106950]
MDKLILPSLSEILAHNQSTVAERSRAKAERQWHVSVAATEQLLLNTLVTVSHDATQGLVLVSPVPVFSDPILTQSLQTVTFTAKPFNPLALMPFQMPVSVACTDEIGSHESVMPLLSVDPLAREQFCLVFTQKFALVLVLAEDNNGEKAFSFSFEPEIVQQAWEAIGARVRLSHPDLFADLEGLVQKYSLVSPDYRLVMQFSQLLLAQLPEPEADKEKKAGGYGVAFSSPTASASRTHRPDVELLQAFAHEVRTPLTTIRTMTRLLLKQQNLSAKVIKRLEIIDHECTEQIDRMELLFKAAELETCTSVKSTNAQLTVMSLDQVLQQSIPRWQLAANRRNLTLDVVLPQQLPTVVSNPTMLDRVLTGLMENFTRSLPPGSHIEVQVIPAGDQIKLQLLPKPQSLDNSFAKAFPCQPPIRKAIGQLLTFQPETGTISLNLAATKHLFQAIGGKLIVRERPQQGEVLTIFLPLKE